MPALDTQYSRGRAGVGRAGRNIDDISAHTALVTLLREHLTSGQLGKEHGSLGIDIHDEIVAFLGHLKQVATHLGRDACDVDQRVDTTGRLDGGFDESRAVVCICEVACNVDEILAQSLDLLLAVGSGADVHTDNDIAAGKEGFGGFVADAAEGTGDNGALFHGDGLLFVI